MNTRGADMLALKPLRETRSMPRTTGADNDTVIDITKHAAKECEAF